jgi:dual oxidase
VADYNSIREAVGLKRLYWTEILPPRVRESDRKRGPKISFDSDTESNTPKETNGNGETSIRYDVDEDTIDGKPSLEYPPDFDSFTPLEKRLYRLYRGDLNAIDVYVGGMLESDPEEGRPGPLFRKIIWEQFLRLRDADRFWFENTANGIFSEAEIAQIRQIRLWDILVNASDIPPEAIQKEVFQFSAGSPCPQPQQISSKILEPCVILAGWDYFHGSEITFVLVILLLIIIPVGISLSAYGTIKLQNRVRRQTKAKQDTVLFGKNYDKLYVREWLRPHHKRFVKIRIGPDAALYTISRKNEMLRKLDFIKVQHLVVEITTDSSHKPMLLIRSPRDHDLVLQFANSGSQKKFLNRLEHFLFNHKKTLELIHTYKDVMLANAETKEKRQKRLEHFFREAYAITFGLKNQPSEGRIGGDKVTAGDGKSDDVIMVMRTSLSKQEFAEALGMKIDSLFVKQMFNCVDKDNDGRISFQEFLDTVVLFTRGKTDDKLRIIFDMCDYNGNGVIDKTELQKMLTSLVDIAKTNSMSEQQVRPKIRTCVIFNKFFNDCFKLFYLRFAANHRSWI